MYDSLIILIEHKTKLHQLTTALDFPTLQAFEVEFITEYIEALTPITTTIDRLQSDRDIHCGELLTVLLVLRTNLPA